MNFGYEGTLEDPFLARAPQKKPHMVRFWFQEPYYSTTMTKTCFKRLR